MGRAARGADGLGARHLRPVRLRRGVGGGEAADRQFPGRARAAARHGRGAGAPVVPAGGARRLRGGVRACGAGPARHPGAAAGLGEGAGERPGELPGRGLSAPVRARGAGRRGHGLRHVPSAAGLGRRRTQRHGRGARPRGTRPRVVRGAVALPVRHRPDLGGRVRQPARGRRAAPAGLGRPALRGAGAGRALRAAGRAGCGAGGPRLPGPGGRGAGGGGRLLPVERGALAADHRRGGRGHLPHGRRTSPNWPCP